MDPKDFPSEEAEWRASNAQDVLASAQVVDTLDEAISDCGLVIGTSARERRILAVTNSRECAYKCISEVGTHSVAILFGREDRGLTNEELHKCHYHVHIPTNPEYSSLNLAAAVQVITYELRMACLYKQQGHEAVHIDDWDMPPAKSEALESYYQHLQTLEKLAFAAVIRAKR